MRLLSRFSIAIVLPVVMILLVTLSVGIFTIVSYQEERKTLLSQVNNTLKALLDERVGRLENEFSQMESELIVTAARGATARALNGFVRSWAVLGENQRQQLQKIYITDNPHPVGSKQNLTWSGDDSTYSTVHAQAHPELRAMLEAYGYYDIFLIDLEGNIVYSVFKESDFATNLQVGKYKDSGLARAYRRALKADAGQVIFEDFTPYAPSADAPAAFLAHPIFNRQGKRLGVVSFQLPDGPISEVMNAPTGMGETGEVYLLGEDALFRSDSGVEGAPARIGLSGVNSVAVQKALAGETGIAEGLGDDGTPVITAFAPTNAFGKTWAVVAEQDVKEVFQGADSLVRTLIFNGLIVVAGISVIAFLVARSLVKPLSTVSRSMTAIAGANYETAVGGTNRGDEIGAIAKSLESFRVSLIEAQDAAKESEFRGAAFASSSAAIMMVGNDLDILHMNETGISLLTKYEEVFQSVVPEFKANNVVGQCADIFHPPELRKRVRSILEDDANLPYHATIAVDEMRLTLEINRVKGPSGEAIGYVVEWADVSVEFINQALLKSIEANQIKIEFTPEGAVANGNALLCSALAEPESDLVGRAISDLFEFDETLAKERGNVFDRVCNGESVFGRFVMRRSDGELVALDGGFSPVIDAKDQLLRVVLIANDVTEARREIERAEEQRVVMEASQNQVVDALRDGLSRLSDGDLTVELTDAFSENYDQLRVDFNSAVD
ncbi:HAMP domain-containing protein, partial [Aliiroseovarius lamellibrachiae]|uniref:HAMP domain-containing protein n=1 Tax=Aliiroseovarius lamellibrachiae TaxID=1924933 RepID=UPI001BDFC67F